MTIRDRLAGGSLGFGAAPLGNMFRELTDEEAAATVDAAWQAGTRFFDTAPQYGAGLSEIRLGQQLAKHDRDEYELSTKVGRLILDELDTGPRQFDEKGNLFSAGRANRMVYDYSEKGTLKSIEDSLSCLNVDQLDFVWVHDVAQDFHGDGWLAQFEIARTGAFRALSELRDEAVIKGWGLGVNRVEPIELTLSLTDVAPDAMLLAGRYTLLDHELALQRLMPAAAAKGVDIVIGGPYSSGVLAGGAHFEYQPAPPEIIAKVERIKAIAERNGVPIKAAALHFALAHPRSFRSFPVRADPNASQKTMRRSTPLFQKCFGVRCAINTSSHPTRRYPSTDDRASGGVPRHHRWLRGPQAARRRLRPRPSRRAAGGRRRRWKGFRGRVLGEPDVTRQFDFGTVTTSGSAVFGVFNGGDATDIVYDEDARLPFTASVFAPESAGVHSLLAAGFAARWPLALRRTRSHRELHAVQLGLDRPVLTPTDTPTVTLREG